MVAFRTRMISMFVPPNHVGYIDRDTIDGICPLCNGWIIIRFAGTAPRASLRCEHGCATSDIIRASLGR
jgi:hypothetical protein